MTYMARRHRNVYAGADSTAKLPVRGKVNEPWEIVMLAYATALDALNRRLLTRDPRKEIKATKKKLEGRFALLRFLAIRNGHRRILPIIEEYRRLAEMYLAGYLPPGVYAAELERLSWQVGLPPFAIQAVKLQVRA